MTDIDLMERSYDRFKDFFLLFRLKQEIVSHSTDDMFGKHDYYIRGQTRLLHKFKFVHICLCTNLNLCKELMKGM